eukprot:m.101230 g.101230  ORF g.101230 m.101230 type:complete len:148 (+) comp12572_c4_seq1:863-1306(+)
MDWRSWLLISDHICWSKLPSNSFLQGIIDYIVVAEVDDRRAFFRDLASTANLVFTGAEHSLGGSILPSSVTAVLLIVGTVVIVAIAVVVLFKYKSKKAERADIQKHIAANLEFDDTVYGDYSDAYSTVYSDTYTYATVSEDATESLA